MYVLSDMVLNNTIEERVALLEIQVTVIQDDVIDLEVNLMELEGDVNFLLTNKSSRMRDCWDWNKLVIKLLWNLQRSFR